MPNFKIMFLDIWPIAVFYGIFLAIASCESAFTKDFMRGNPWDRELLSLTMTPIPTPPTPLLTHTSYLDDSIPPIIISCLPSVPNISPDTLVLYISCTGRSYELGGSVTLTSPSAAPVIISAASCWFLMERKSFIALLRWKFWVKFLTFLVTVLLSPIWKWRLCWRQPFPLHIYLSPLIFFYSSKLFSASVFNSISNFSSASIFSFVFTSICLYVYVCIRFLSPSPSQNIVVHIVYVLYIL